MDLFGLAQEYWAFVAHPVIVAGVIQAMKAGWKSFFRSHHVGMRLLPFIPIVLGTVGGLLLPVETMQEKLLIGGALGQLSAFLYKVVTRSLVRKVKLLEVADRRESAGF